MPLSLLERSYWRTRLAYLVYVDEDDKIVVCQVHFVRMTDSIRNLLNHGISVQDVVTANSCTYGKLLKPNQYIGSLQILDTKMPAVNLQVQSTQKSGVGQCDR